MQSVILLNNVDKDKILKEIEIKKNSKRRNCRGTDKSIHVCYFNWPTPFISNNDSRYSRLYKKIEKYIKKIYYKR